MEIKGIKINVVVLSMLIIVLAFFAGQHLFKLYNIEKPLTDELKSVKGVQDVKLLESGDKTDVSVKLSSDVDFYKRYHQLEKIASEKLGNELGKIIVNNEDNSLEEIYYQMHYYIFEGISTYRFSYMKNEIKEIAEKNNVSDYRVWVDEKAVYLKLNRGKTSYYKVIPRQGITVSFKAGGDSSG
ncbi:hypothetical protein [Halothermothrix orenii]|uniref:Uncharacterized protein n=1 Tax=Halothermothrix orenii (strain H 168 / OCM 544 / DSM 9562) TaxID=373903 RepID=B8CXC5_HALOH|nr:hypothetical protein [Halothermothrix orenii]ACL69944.1 hypothetical protein Hore_11940 [Halothermothrix orenii H 168]